MSLYTKAFLKFKTCFNCKGSVTYRFCPRETSYGRSSGDPPPHPPLETSRTFFDTTEAPAALFIVQALRLSAVYKSIKVHLRQGQDQIMSIQIYFKYKYTYENAGFCILCMDVFKILKTIEIFHDFHRETSQATTPPPQRPHVC